MKAFIFFLLILAGCVSPDKKYETHIHNEGDGNTVNINYTVEVPIDIDTSAEVPINVVPK